MRVLVDAIHADLLHSLRLLFEDRYGWEMFVPSGMAWYHSGIWRFEHERLGDQVARQFLAEWGDDRQGPGDYSLRQDTTHPTRETKRVTLEQARATSWDLVIATLAENEAGLHGFARDVGATYGIQVGNQGALNQLGLADFVMSSVTMPHVKLWMPHVFYHQEFDLADFRFTYPPADRDLVATRVQCITETDEYARFRAVAGLVPEVRFRHYGHCGARDDLWGGDAPTTAEVATQMRAAGIAWHDKRWSDGYGHVVHDWFAVGRPVIGSTRYYTGQTDGIEKLAAPLFVEGVTSFDMDRRSDAELAELVRRLATDDEYHWTISHQAYDRFREVVSFDNEAREIRKMLDNVMSDRKVAA